MADVHSKAARSKNMAAIKARNTRPEMLVRRALHQAGFRYRLHVVGVQDKLRELGWRVMLVWECVLKGKNKMPADQLIADISHWLRNGSSFAELPAT